MAGFCIVVRGMVFLLIILCPLCIEQEREKSGKQAHPFNSPLRNCMRNERERERESLAFDWFVVLI